MAMKLNQTAVKHARQLISNHRRVTDSDWSEAQATPEEENEFVDSSGWNACADWFLGIDTDENEATKGHKAFPSGDFENIHREGIVPSDGAPHSTGMMKSKRRQPIC